MDLVWLCDFVACSCRAAGQLQLLRGVFHLAAVPRKDGGRPLPQMWKSSVQNQAISNNTYQANIIRYYKQSIHFSTWTCGTRWNPCSILQFSHRSHVHPELRKVAIDHGTPSVLNQSLATRRCAGFGKLHTERSRCDVLWCTTILWANPLLKK